MEPRTPQKRTFRLSVKKEVPELPRGTRVHRPGPPSTDRSTWIGAVLWPRSCVPVFKMQGNVLLHRFLHCPG